MFGPKDPLRVKYTGEQDMVKQISAIRGRKTQTNTGSRTWVLGNMEGGTHFHGPRKLKEHSNRVNDLGDLKVSHETESHFGMFSPTG